MLGKLPPEQPVKRRADAAEGEVAFGDMVKKEKVVYQTGIFIRGRTIAGVLAIDEPLPGVEHGLCIRMCLEDFHSTPVCLSWFPSSVPTIVAAHGP